MKQSYSAEVKFIIFLGVNKLRDNETFQMHGLSFEKGYVYKVTPEVAEYVKVLGSKNIPEFIIVKGIKEGIVGFPK
jgi:hypothetical protein